jgi:hypothetical protein
MCSGDHAKGMSLEECRYWPNVRGVLSEFSYFIEVRPSLKEFVKSTTMKVQITMYISQ